MQRSTIVLAVLGVDLKTGLDQVTHVRLEIGSQVNQLVVERQDVRELAKLDVAHIRCALVCLQGNLHLVMHVVITDGGYLNLNLTVRMLGVPARGSLLEEFLMLSDECPHRQLRGVRSGTDQSECGEHAQYQCESQQFLHFFFLL